MVRLLTPKRLKLPSERTFVAKYERRKKVTFYQIQQ